MFVKLSDRCCEFIMRKSTSSTVAVHYYYHASSNTNQSQPR